MNNEDEAFCFKLCDMDKGAKINWEEFKHYFHIMSDKAHTIKKERYI